MIFLELKTCLSQLTLIVSVVLLCCYLHYTKKIFYQFNGLVMFKKVIATMVSAVCLSFMLSMEVSAMENGDASYYANKFQGRKTASGQRYDKNKLTAAHRKLAFGTQVKVTNLKNKRSVIVTINDRGPFIKKRVIDVSYIAAKKLGLVRAGVAPVKVMVIK